MPEALANRTAWTIAGIAAGWILTIATLVYGVAHDDGASETIQRHHTHLIADHEKRIRANEARQAETDALLKAMRVDIQYLKESVDRIERSLQRINQHVRETPDDFPAEPLGRHLPRSSPEAPAVRPSQQDAGGGEEMLKGASLVTNASRRFFTPAKLEVFGSDVR